jgi:hypothetical protein
MVKLLNSNILSILKCNLLLESGREVFALVPVHLGKNIYLSTVFPIPGLSRGSSRSFLFALYQYRSVLGIAAGYQG